MVRAEWFQANEFTIECVSRVYHNMGIMTLTGPKPVHWSNISYQCTASNGRLVSEENLNHGHDFVWLFDG